MLGIVAYTVMKKNSEPTRESDSEDSECYEDDTLESAVRVYNRRVFERRLCELSLLLGFLLLVFVTIYLFRLKNSDTRG